MPSWGRHGWPRKDEGLRIYRERCGSYLLLDPDSKHSSFPGAYDATGNVFPGPRPSLGSTTVRANYIFQGGVKRVQWSEIPEEWQEAFRRWLDAEPETIRGFWLVGQQPKQEAKP